VKLFRRRKPENGEEEDELVFDTDGEEEDSGQEMAEATAGTGTSADAAAPDAAASPVAQAGPILTPNDPLAQMRADAAGEAAAAQTPFEGAAPAPQPDDPLDAGLMDLFREAKNEVQESTLASELPDIPIQDLLSDLVSVSECLGITPRVRAKPRQDRALDSDPELRQAGK
jgi:hypothetical protein